MGLMSSPTITHPYDVGGDLLFWHDFAESVRKYHTTSNTSDDKRRMEARVTSNLLIGTGMFIYIYSLFFFLLY